MNPQFPIYIVSKGRWKSRLTSKAFERMRVPYRIVVEEDEYADYCSVIDKAKVLVLDKSYQRNYDIFRDMGTGGTGSGPARNFAWEHALTSGHSWYWCVDDNIGGFGRFNGVRDKVCDGTIFRCMEDFVLRYKNVAMAGPTYRFSIGLWQGLPPFFLNTRIYSCNLIRTSVPFRWRGRYNEDTDLSLRLLKAGWCTVLFNAFFQNKMGTMTTKGGNTDTIYVGGTMPKSKMLVEMHPDCCNLSWRWGRAHHHVDYARFAHGLVRDPEVSIVAGVDEYGMRPKPQKNGPLKRSPPKEQRARIKSSSSPSCGDTT